MLLSEIWIKKDEFPLYYLKDYTLFDDCRSDTKSGGIMMYVRRNSGFIVECKGMRTAEMFSIFIKNQGIYIIGIYRNHKYDISDFCEEIENKISTISYRNLYVIGDLNINIKKKEKQDIRLEEYMALMGSAGLKCCIDLNTRFEGHSEPCNDHIYHRNARDYFNSFYILKYLVADHMPIICTFNYRNEWSVRGKRRVKAGRRSILDHDLIGKKIDELEIHCKIGNDFNIDNYYYSFFGRIREIVGNTPRIESISGTISKVVPWIDDNFRGLIE